MKKIIIMMSMMLALNVSFLVSAEESVPEMTIYESEDYGISLELPADYMKFDLNTDSSDPNLAIINMTIDELEEYLIMSETVFIAMSEDQNYWLDLGSYYTDKVSPEQMTEDDIKSYAMEIEAVCFMKADIFEGCDLYNTEDISFLKTAFHNAEETKYEIKYSTAYNGIGYELTFKKQGNGAFTEDDMKLIESILESITLN